MATAILNPVVASISGTVGRMVFYTRNGSTVMRQWIKPPNPRTLAQQTNRDRFRQAMAAWQGLEDEDKAVYNRKARSRGMTGHNLFIKRYMRDTLCGFKLHMKTHAADTCGEKTDRSSSCPSFFIVEKEAGVYLTQMGNKEISLTRSSLNPVRRQADTDRASVRAVRSIATSASFDRSLSRRLSDRLFFALFCGETKKGTSRPCSGSFPSLPGIPGTGSYSAHTAFPFVTAPSIEGITGLLRPSPLRRREPGG